MHIIVNLQGPLSSGRNVRPPYDPPPINQPYTLPLTPPTTVWSSTAPALCLYSGDCVYALTHAHYTPHTVYTSTLNPHIFKPHP